MKYFNFLLLSILLLQTSFCFSQAYKYECELTNYSNGKENDWMCSTTGDIKGPKLTLKCRKNMTVEFLFLLKGQIENFNKLFERDKKYTTKLYLSNGEVLSFDGTYFIGQIVFGSQEIKSNQIVVNDQGKYAMTQLRKYNITKIFFGGHSINTPSYRSAATIDAMCKTLISKTGDQGQYGKSPNANTTTIKNNNTNNNSRTTNPSANYRSEADIELPLKIDGHSPTYNTTISPIGDDNVYSVRTKTGKYVDDTGFKDYEVTSDSYWAKIDAKTEAAFLVKTLDNNTGSSRKATIKVSANGVTTVMYITQPAMKASVKKVWIEHNKWNGLVKGMKIHVNFETYGVRGITGTCAAYFSFANGQKLMDYNGMFRAMDGQVSCGENFRPGYDSSTYNDFVLFMPYSELHVNGKADCKVNVEVQIDGQVATGESIGFTMN